MSVTLPTSLKAAAEGFAERERASLSQFIALALAEKVGATRAAEFFAESGKGADAERAGRWLEARPETAG